MVKNKSGDGNRKWWFLLGGLGVVILGLVIGIVVVLKSDRFTIDSREEALEFLADYINTDAPETLIEATDRALAAATNDRVKADIYMIRANALFNYNAVNDNKYIEQMLDSAYKAEDLFPTSQSAYRIYTGEKIMGDKEKAEEYLEKAKDRGLMNNSGKG